MDDALQEKLKKKYDAGFTTNVESVTLPPGLDENTIKQISKIKKDNLSSKRIFEFCNFLRLKEDNKYMYFYKKFTN